ncbi:MAG: putative endonuclease 4 [Candidatus Poribacteria bacterium]|nr:MAG: putative endonuclease 4 [Candidatus Poribacteria bacterium]
MSVSPPIGAHIRTDKGWTGLFRYAKEWGAEVIQIFTGSPRQYHSKRYQPAEVENYLRAWKAAGEPLVISHASYLVNLASPKEEVRRKARETFAAELDRCEALGLPLVVLHIGSALDAPPQEALETVLRELNELIRQTGSVRVLLENAAGQGSSLGATFEEIAWLLERLEPPERFGVCLDTCHAFAAGYDLRGDAYEETWKQFEELIGLDRLFVLHFNDSKGPLGDRKDRHEHIGKGGLGEEPFRRLLHDPRLRAIPVFIETPDDLKWHARNLARLKALRDQEG